MIRNIETAILVAPLAPATWKGAFMPTKILIAAWGCTKDNTLFFNVGEVGRLQRVRFESALVAVCTFQWMRVLGVRGKTWYVDPDSDSIETDWHLWSWEARPLVRLRWDLGDWHY